MPSRSFLAWRPMRFVTNDLPISSLPSPRHCVRHSCCRRRTRPRPEARLCVCNCRAKAAGGPAELRLRSPAGRRHGRQLADPMRRFRCQRTRMQANLTVCPMLHGPLTMSNRPQGACNTMLPAPDPDSTKDCSIAPIGRAARQPDTSQFHQPDRGFVSVDPRPGDSEKLAAIDQAFRQPRSNRPISGQRRTRLSARAQPWPR